MGARAGGDTPEGQQAYGLLAWAHQDLEGRAGEALDRVRELAMQSTGAGLREVQDVGTMLHRLVGSLIGRAAPEQVAGIASQMAAVPQLAGIADQVMDLAAWEHEMRDSHGHWVKGGSTISDQVAQDHPRHAPVSDAVENVARAHAAAAAAEMAGTLRAEHASIVHEILDKIDKTNKELARTQAEAATKEAHAARVKLAIEAGVALAGALLAMALAAVGVAPMIAVAAALGPVAVQLITEFHKRV